MNSDDLIGVIQEETGFSSEKIKSVLDAFQGIVNTELSAGREVEIPGFGELTIVSHPHKAEGTLAKTPDGKPQATIELSSTAYIPYVDLSKKTVSKKILALLPEHVARHYQTVPFGEKDGKLQIAMIDPEDREAIEFIKKKTGKILDLNICTQSDLNHILDQYTGISGELRQIVASVGDDEVKEVSSLKVQDKVKEEEILQNAPAAKIVQSLISRAVREEASDVHIEPAEEEIIVRFRIDGVLKKVISLPIEILPSIVSRVKILSGMKIDETRLPQDGRFQINLDQSEVDFRVSTFPTVNGEKIVMRILDKSGGVLSMEQLGIRGSAFQKLDDNIHKAHGMILVTGPTGSGKTTTLYAVIQKLMSVTTNIVTLEDPVEYRIASINQGQVRSDIGFTFASGLRSILRQDPNIIMIGEIRDIETADMAVHSALTGHIVLSTLHTNDAAGAIPRLIDMKVEPFLINSSLNAVVAQRLCRKICEDCKEEIQIEPTVKEEIEKELKKLPDNEKQPDQIKLFKGKGCGTCDKTGYHGRIGIYEVLVLTNEMKELVNNRASGTTISETAIKGGMVTMKQDGILKALNGVTTIEEIWRVTKE